MRKALVSVIVPCFNQVQFLNEALESVCNQDYDDWECIIVNDGSNDNTEEIAMNWCEKDIRFKYFKKENGGLSSARNTGITIAKGTYILPLDADDKIAKNYMSLAIQAFMKDTSLKIAYSRAEFFGNKLGEWNLASYSLLSMCRYNMIFCSAFFRKSDWKKLGGYDENMKYGLEDWEFWIHLLKDGGEVKQIDEIGFYYRVKKDSMIKNMTQEQIQYSQDYVLLKHKDLFYKNYDILLKEKKEINYNLKSKKFILNLFTNKFLGFKLFKKIK